MLKSCKNSHFELIRNEELNKLGNRILQVDSEPKAKNGCFGIYYLCEIEEENND